MQVLAGGTGLRGLEQHDLGGYVSGQLCRAALGHQRTPVEDGQRVTALGLIHVVGGDQYGRAFLHQVKQ